MVEKACTFFGHRECYSLDEQALTDTIEDLIRKGVDTFYVGNQGQFDSTVYACLKQLRAVAVPAERPGRVVLDARRGR